jgi:hypothetical protein
VANISAMGRACAAASGTFRASTRATRTGLAPLASSGAMTFSRLPTTSRLITAASAPNRNGRISFRT